MRIKVRHGGKMGEVEIADQVERDALPAGKGDGGGVCGVLQADFRARRGEDIDIEREEERQPRENQHEEDRHLAALAASCRHWR